MIDSAVQTVTAAKATQNTLEQNIYTADIKIALHNTETTSHPYIRAQLASLSGNPVVPGPNSGTRTFIINLDAKPAVTNVVVQGGSENASTIFINGPASDANGLALTYNITTDDPELTFSKTAGIKPHEKVSITVAKVSVPTLKSFEITATNTVGETSAESVEIEFTVNPIEVTGQPSIIYPINDAKTEYYNGFTFTWSAAEIVIDMDNRAAYPSDGSEP